MKLFGKILNGKKPLAITQKVYYVKSVLFGVILVRIFPASSLIWTEYEGISPYSVRMRKNAEKMRTRITPNMDTFYEADNEQGFTNIALT